MVSLANEEALKHIIYYNGRVLTGTELTMKVRRVEEVFTVEEIFGYLEEHLEVRETIEIQQVSISAHTFAINANKIETGTPLPAKATHDPTQAPPRGVGARRPCICRT